MKWSCLALAAALALSPAPAGAREKIAVLDLKDNGVGPDAAALLTSALARKLASFGLYDVVTRADVRNLLSHEQDKLLLGCNKAGCYAELGGILKADWLLTGGVGQVGQAYVIDLQRIKVEKGEVAARVERRHTGERALLLGEIEIAAQQVLADLLRAQSGELLLAVSEEGADVAVDGAIVGVSPSLGRLSLPAGPHDLRVTRDGFVAWARTIQIQPQEALPLDVALVPSAKFIEGYEARAVLSRRLAWIGAAAFLVLEGAALGLRGYTLGTYDPIEERYNSAEIQRDPALRMQYYEQHKGDMQTAEVLDTTALGLAIGGVLVGAASLYFFIAGDDPDRYIRFHGNAAAPAAPAAPAAQAGGFSLAF